MRWVAILTAAVLSAQVGGQQRPTVKPALGAPVTTQNQKASYAVGVDLGRRLRQQGIELDQDAMILGFREALGGKHLRMSDMELRDNLSRFLGETRLKTAAAARIAGPENQRKGEAFLATNRRNPGVVVLPSGLQYRVLRAGTGPKPKSTDTVTVNYRGALIDGTEFDSSYNRGEPSSFPVTGVIKGWTEALQLMPAGSKWQIFVPSQLAYGPRGAGNVIGPNCALVFEMELVGIK